MPEPSDETEPGTIRAEASPASAPRAVRRRSPSASPARKKPDTTRVRASVADARHITMPLPFFALSILAAQTIIAALIAYSGLTNNQKFGLLAAVLGIIVYVIHTVAQITRTKPENLSADMAHAIREIEVSRAESERALRKANEARRQTEGPEFQHTVDRAVAVALERQGIVGAVPKRSRRMPTLPPGDPD